jgi:ferritin-like metal-binding protein YciE
MPHTVQLTKWLELAYGVEREVIDMLTEQLPDLTGQDEREAKIQEHLEQTHRHVAMVDECITRLGGEASALDKGGLASFLHGMMGRGVDIGGGTGGTGVLGAVVQGIMSQRSMLPHGVLVKHSIADFAAEHYEIATYTTLITAAHGCRDEETMRVCQEILREEQEMARWLAQRLPDDVHGVVRLLLQKEEEKEGGEKRAELPLDLDLAGTFKGGWLYAVVNDEQHAAQAEQALAEMDMEPLRLQGPEVAAHLRGDFGGILARIGRIIKSFGYEQHYAEHYAMHAERGRILLAVQCPDQAAADEVTEKLKRHGAFDIRYFSDLGTQRMPE